MIGKTDTIRMWMMTMDMRIRGTTMRIKDTIKAAKKAIKLAEKNPMLYTGEEILYMKRALRMAKEDLKRKREKMSKGFKNEATTWVSQTNVSNATGGADDGVCGESIEPEQPGQP